MQHRASEQVILKDAGAPPLEIHPLHLSGQPSNRVNFVFFSDGYTHLERDKFLGDAFRLAQDLTANQTFAPVLPLLNFYAAFSPSAESGIGVGGKQKDTVFGLYRDGTELRAVYPGKMEVLEAACASLSRRCDYPILLGNDPLYGGLGGDVSITTSSRLNGPLVLRHELGHSIIEVGEEYDGGDTRGYFGANASPNVTAKGFKWAHWLTPHSPTHSHSHPHSHAPVTVEPRIERSIMPIQAYPWTLLNHSTPYRASFSSSGSYSRHLIRMSLSGLPDASHLSITLDGKDVEWKPVPGIGVDRWHYDLLHGWALEGGEHELVFWLGDRADERIAQLCSFEVLEYGSEEEFNTTPGVISAFPTFSEDNITSYRPTNENCLMRLVTFPNFCSPCLESLWLHLLAHVDLIDDLSISALSPSPSESESGSKTNTTTISLQLVPFGQLRYTALTLQQNPSSPAPLFVPTPSGESYEITWSKGGRVLEEFANQTSIEVRDWEEGKWSVDVRLYTDDVRKDVEGKLTARRVF